MILPCLLYRPICLVPLEPTLDVVSLLQAPSTSPQVALVLHHYDQVENEDYPPIHKKHRCVQPRSRAQRRQSDRVDNRREWK